MQETRQTPNYFFYRQQMGELAVRMHLNVVILYNCLLDLGPDAILAQPEEELW
jgi:hypothetical protein